MATAKAFDSYTLRIYSGAEGRVGLLLCYDRNRFIGRIDFYADGEEMPEGYLWHPTSGQEYIILIMPMSRFDSVVSTVRKESPLQLYINANRGPGVSTKGQGHLATTDREPVGEEEGTL